MYYYLRFRSARLKPLARNGPDAEVIWANQKVLTSWTPRTLSLRATGPNVDLMDCVSISFAVAVAVAWAWTGPRDALGASDDEERPVRERERAVRLATQNTLLTASQLRRPARNPSVNILFIFHKNHLRPGADA